MTAIMGQKEDVRSRLPTSAESEKLMRLLPLGVFGRRARRGPPPQLYTQFRNINRPYRTVRLHTKSQYDPYR